MGKYFLLKYLCVYGNFLLPFDIWSYPYNCPVLFDMLFLLLVEILQIYNLEITFRGKLGQFRIVPLNTVATLV